MTHRLAEEVLEEWRRRYEAGESPNKFCRDYAVTRTKIFTELHRMGVKMRPRFGRYEKPLQEDQK